MPLTRHPLACLLLLGMAAAAFTAEPTTEPEQSTPAVVEELPPVIAPQDWMVLPRVGDYHRAALHIDPIEAQVARGEWAAPKPGEQVRAAAGGDIAWRADEEPRPGDLAGGYAYAEFDSPAAGVMLLEAAGAAAVCLNGEWLPGDPYATGWFRPPAEVAAGKNWLLVHLANPRSKPRLVRPAASVALLASQATLPDLLLGDKITLVGSVPLVNASNESLSDLSLSVGWEGEKPTKQRLRSIDARLVTPLTFKLPAVPEGLAVGKEVKLRLSVVNTDPAADVLASVECKVRVVGPADHRTETFVSAIDGSVQPYSVLPATDNEGKADGLLVSLHDAGQTSQDCLGSHQPLSGVQMLAPGGRGRWGFDWEDWGRLDAIEAIDTFQQRQRQRGTPLDEDRVALVGRGLGGHGALSLATLEPSRFAAVGIADGWISFYTQGGAVATPPNAGPMDQLLARQAANNDPLRVLNNLAGMGVYVLHTGRDRVPAEESRYLRERLGEFHNDFTYREPVAGDSAGSLLAEQIEWLAKRTRQKPQELDEVQFSTPDVGALSTYGWVSLLGADRQGGVTRVHLRRDLVRREVTGTTENARRLRIDFAGWPADAKEPGFRVRVDGGSWIEFNPGREGEALALARNDEGDWRRVPDVAAGSMSQFASLFKGPDRAGGFKSAFCCRPLLVYGTTGSDDEQHWAAAKARYDAHLFLYRGAGRLEVVPDKTLVDANRKQNADPRSAAIRDASRSLVLYGNRSTNRAWSALQREAFQRRRRVLRVDAGRAWVGRRPESGDDLALLAVRPRVGGSRATVGVVGGTGPFGMRMTTRLRYFWSGIAYPDFLLFGADSIDPKSGGRPSEDVRAAGYFDSDWGVDSGAVLWRDLAI